jgi:hypothetical protein
MEMVRNEEVREEAHPMLAVTTVGSDAGAGARHDAHFGLGIWIGSRDGDGGEEGDEEGGEEDGAHVERWS